MHGDYRGALNALQQALQDRALTGDVKERAKTEAKQLQEILNQQGTAALDWTHSITQTLDMGMTATLRLPGTKTHALKALQPILVVLERDFPPDSIERTDLVARITDDLSSALGILPIRIQLLGMENGSVIATFAIADADGESPTAHPTSAAI